MKVNWIPFVLTIAAVALAAAIGELDSSVRCAVSVIAVIASLLPALSSSPYREIDKQEIDRR